MRPLLAASALLLLCRDAVAADYVADPLTEAAFPGRGAQGGSFSPDGWTTTGPTDALWYEIPDALVAGKIGFSVRGMAHSGGPLSGADHDLFAMYQAPSGQAEPVAYSPYFRNNDFKAFLRIFGDQEPDRAGAMKLEFIRCPRGEPWHHDTPCPPGCGDEALAYANGSDKDIGWDASAWYRIEVAWGNGTIAFSRDGAQLAAIPYSDTYAPQPLRVRLGSPRHGISEVAVMPLGLTFKDVAVSGDAGAMTPICSSSGTGGAGGAAGTGGEASGGGGGEGGNPGATGEELSPLQDVTAASWAPDTVFEDAADLNIEGDNAAPAAIAYLRFPAPSGPVLKAVLRVRTHAYSSASGSSGAIHGVADGSWSEDTLTWANRPAFDPQSYGNTIPVPEDTAVEWDVTPLVAAGTLNFAIVSTDSDGVHYRSKEAESGVHRPRLVLTLDPSGAAGSTGSSTGGTGAGGSAPGGGNGGGESNGSAGAGIPGSAGGTGGAGPSAGGNGAEGGSGGKGVGKLTSTAQDAPEEDGCGCRAAGSPEGSWGWASLSLAALALRRRRSRSA